MVDDRFVSASVDSRYKKLGSGGPEQLQILERNNNHELENSFEYLTPAVGRARQAIHKERRSPPNSCLKRSGKGDGKLTILEQNGL